MKRRPTIGAAALFIAVFSAAILIFAVKSNSAQRPGAYAETSIPDVPVEISSSPEGTPAEPARAAPMPANETWDYHTVIGYNGQASEMHLTFDDGPGEDTEQVLNILDRYGVRATFCMTGQKVEEFPNMAREVLARGHLLCNHSYSHDPAINRGSAAGIVEDIVHANNVFARYLNQATPVLYRAPEGLFFGSVPSALSEVHMKAFGWSIDSLDWTTPGVDRIVSNVVSSAGPQKIVLLHDGGGRSRSQTVSALPKIIEGLQSAGYTLTTPD